MAKSLYRVENLALAALLREMREKQGLVQTQFAARVGRNQTYVSNVELGIRRLDVVELRDYCAALGVSLQDFVQMWEARLPKAKARRTPARKP